MFTEFFSSQALSSQSPDLPADIFASGAGAVVFLPVGDRIAAICFGHVHIALNDDAFERQVGLKVTLNTVPRGQLRTLDLATPDAVTFQKRVQASRDSDLQAFGVDMLRDLARVAGGTPTNLKFARFVAGKDSLSITCDLWDEGTAQFLALTRQPSILSGSKASLLSPLAFDPGSRWHYGIGVDWLGQVIEKIDGRTIDRFCVEEIFGPLGMSDTTFGLAPEARSNLGTIFSREPDGTLAAGKLNLDPPEAPQFYGMGHALYSTAGDYIRFLRMWLNGGELEGVRVLRRETATDFLSNKLEGMDLLRLRSTLPIATHDLDIFPGFKKGHSLGFARIEENLPDRRAKGSQFWAGVLNTHFWVDPDRQVAAVLMTQLTPFYDPQFMNSLTEFERAVYAQS